MRKSFSAEFKAKVAIEAIKGDKTLAELSSLYEVHQNQISNWKKQFLAGAIEIFKKTPATSEREQERNTDHLYKKIGQLEVERDFLKKKWEQLQNL